jgi:hypothetical protein
MTEIAGSELRVRQNTGLIEKIAKLPQDRNLGKS